MMKLEHTLYLFIVAGAFMIFSAQISNNGKVELFHSLDLQKNSGGAPVAKTGAPGEGTCTSCHTGSVMDGSNQNILKVLDGGVEVTEYVPGVTYQVSLSLATGNVKEGFGSTVLTSSNTAAGTFPGSGLVGTNLSVSGGRHYATHRAMSSNEGNVSWDWDWTAPSTESGPVTFYVASNKANGNNASSGDQIFVSQHVLQSVVSVKEEVLDGFEFNAGYNSSTKKLTLNFTTLTSDNIFINLVDLTGKSVFSAQLGVAAIGANKHSIQLGNELEKGSYIVQLFVGNKAKTKKIAI